MKSIYAFIFLLTLVLPSFSQDYQDKRQLEFRSYKIGDKVDINQFKKFADLYFPNYLDGWTINNISELPDKYKVLPVAIWQLRSDSSIALTLLDDIILNITISYLSDKEKNQIEIMLTDYFGLKGKTRNYKEPHLLQAYITYWNLITWQKDGLIVQIGNNDMRMPKERAPKKIFWNLVYSNLEMEEKIVSDYKNK